MKYVELKNIMTFVVTAKATVRESDTVEEKTKTDPILKSSNLWAVTK